ncbi:MAG: MFS transporter [Candidatus Bathyarchaeota archaeon]|nr:MAG: MFS transporter [Candidatus Bathyarchaeota archaeon]
MKIYLIPLFSVMVGSITWSISVLYALDLGATIIQVNLISTIRSTMSILLLVPFGILSDRFGRKPMVLYSRILIVLGMILRAMATEPNHLLIASFIGGFAGGGFFPILLSMVGDIAQPDEQRESISTLYLFSSIGMLVGPIISSFLLTQPYITLRNLYQIVAVAQTGILIYLATQIRETRNERPRERLVNYSGSITELIHQTNFQKLLIMAFLYFFSRSIINTYIPIFGKIHLGLSNAEVASFATYRNLGIMIIRLSSATLLTRVSIKPFILFALAIGGISSLASSMAYNYYFIVLILFLAGISYGATAILGNTLVIQNSTTENRGVANSLYNVAQSSGNITNILTSPIADTLGLIPVFLLGGIICFGSIGSILAYKANKTL